jgi:hypothetical protein
MDFRQELTLPAEAIAQHADAIYRHRTAISPGRVTSDSEERNGSGETLPDAVKHGDPQLDNCCDQRRCRPAAPSAGQGAQFGTKHAECLPHDGPA